MLARISLSARAIPRAAGTLNAARATFVRPMTVSAIRSSDSWASNPKVNYDEVRKYTRQPTEDVLVIDTREPDDAAQSPIPSTVNVPLSRLADALSPNFHPGDFQQQFSFPKPTHAQKMIFMDKAGKRSDAAAQAAKKAGYNNVRDYSGGVQEYTQKKAQEKGQ